MTHYKGPQQEDKRREALDVCIDGLEDDDTHLSLSFDASAPSWKSLS